MRYLFSFMHAGCAAAARSGDGSGTHTSSTRKDGGHASTSQSSPDALPKEGGSGGVFGGMQGLPGDLLAGRKTAVFWDIENVRPWAPDIGIPILVHRIKVCYRAPGSKGLQVWAFVMTLCYCCITTVRA